MSGILIRPLAHEDGYATVAVVNAAGGRAVVDASGRVRLARYLPPGTEQVVGVDGSGAVVGYAYLAYREGLLVQETGGAVHPDRQAAGVGAALAGWAVERATVRAGTIAGNVRGVLRALVFEGEDRARALYETCGLRHVRTWTHLEVALPPGDGGWPDPPPGMAIRPMDLDRDWDQVGPVMDVAFADHWGTVPTALAQPPDPSPVDPVPRDVTFDNAPGLCFVALAGATVVGGLLANGKTAEQPGTGRIGSLFVLPEHRRRGIGQALVLTAFTAFRRRGITRVVVDTDTENPTGALRLYQRLGMRPYRRELVLEQTVRSGHEVRVITAKPYTAHL